ncbi:methyltransferase domain-containing protein [Actinomadura flavalba]|uniref:methyltransferase domain-containing protein n=1 Tax=Actinomadura flavalba TaxID=1120938 RepID=UPI000368E452|nr:methyltransferase domain-containing protein [Actinomadura flavalba]
MKTTERIDRLADALQRAGDLTDPEWRRSLHAVPRHLFVPARGYAQPCRWGEGPPPRAIDRGADPEGWWSAVYADTSIITQRDDGASDPASPDGSASSSNSAPGIVFPFLELLAPVAGERVLDIGTGTGWTASLLSDRVGSENVVSIEVDAGLSVQAAENVAAAGYAPELVVGDGAEGWPPRAPYDAVHVTVGVRDIPYAWVRQLKPGGRAVLPWMPEGIGGFRVRMTTTTGGYGLGTFHGTAGYMLLRAQRPESVWFAHHRDDADVTTTRLDPRVIAEADDGAELALHLHVPRLFTTRTMSEDGHLTYHLAETGDPNGSWASVTSGPSGLHTVTQYGDRRLWDEVESAFTQWTDTGSPGLDRFGLLITEHETRLWLDHPPRS